MTRRHTTPDTAASGPAVLYVRVSTDEQARTGVSLDAQEERLRAYCTMRGLPVVTVIREEGVSASKPLAKRPGGARLLGMIAAGTVTNVVALKLDRLFRDLVDTMTTVNAWDRAGVGLHLVDFGGNAVDVGTAVGRLMLGTFAGIAQFERDVISERTVAALAYKRDHGRASGTVPYGYTRDGDNVVPVPAEQATIAQVQEWHAAGDSLRGIAARLTAAGTPTKNGVSGGRARCLCSWTMTSSTRRRADHAQVCLLHPPQARRHRRRLRRPRVHPHDRRTLRHEPHGRAAPQARPHQLRPRHHGRCRARQVGMARVEHRFERMEHQLDHAEAAGQAGIALAAGARSAPTSNFWAS